MIFFFFEWQPASASWSRRYSRLFFLHQQGAGGDVRFLTMSSRQFVPCRYWNLHFYVILRRNSYSKRSVWRVIQVLHRCIWACTPLFEWPVCSSTEGDLQFISQTCQSVIEHVRDIFKVFPCVKRIQYCPHTWYTFALNLNTKTIICGACGKGRLVCLGVC